MNRPRRTSPSREQPGRRRPRRDPVGGSLRVAFLLFTLGAGTALLGGCGTTLSASAAGSSKPKTATCSPGQRVEVENGDFSIVQTCIDSENLVVGDGLSESTYWLFDLSDEDLAACFPETATIELRMRPNANLLGEELRVQQKWALGLEVIQSLELGKEQTATIDMMIRNGRPSPYTPSVIRQLLLERFEGTLPMVYEMNATISHARLEISCRR